MEPERKERRRTPHTAPALPYNPHSLKPSTHGAGPTAVTCRSSALRLHVGGRIGPRPSHLEPLPAGRLERVPTGCQSCLSPLPSRPLGLSGKLFSNSCSMRHSHVKGSGMSAHAYRASSKREAKGGRRASKQVGTSRCLQAS